jgi:pentose-5-phosphate-3-epimerase
MDRRSVKLAPSILTADFGHLAAQVDEAVKAGADRIHVDVMDGHFVPNISMGAPIVQSLRKLAFPPHHSAEGQRVRQMIEAINPACDLELDGGIDSKTAPFGVAAGANVLVAGTAVFGDTEGVTAAINKLRSCLEPAA